MTAQRYIVFLCVAYTALLFAAARTIKPAVCAAVYCQPSDRRYSSMGHWHFHHGIDPSGRPVRCSGRLYRSWTGALRAAAVLFQKAGIFCTRCLSFRYFFGAKAVFFAEPISDIAGPVVTAILYAAVMPRLMGEKKTLLTDAFLRSILNV